MLALIGIVTALVVGLAAFAGLDIAFGEDRRVRRQLRSLDAYEREQAVVAEPLLAPFRQRVMRPSVDAVGRTAQRLSPVDYARYLERQLAAAGHPHGLRVGRLMAGKVIIALGGALLIAAVGLLVGATAGRALVGAVVVLIAGFFVPDLWLADKVQRRRDAIRRQLPDMLDMLTISVEAGLGFDAGVAKLVGNTEGPLAEEFGRALQEIQAGMARRDALRGIADRVGLPELSAFIMAIVQADVFGISVSKVLRTQARELRVKRRQHAEEQAQKAPVKLVFPLVLCVLPATLIVIVGPAVVSIGEGFGLF